MLHSKTSHEKGMARVRARELEQRKHQALCLDCHGGGRAAVEAGLQDEMIPGNNQGWMISTSFGPGLHADQVRSIVQ